MLPTPSSAGFRPLNESPLRFRHPAWDETARLEALRRYLILDTAAEDAFDEIAQIAALVCKAPIAVVNFIEDTRQFFKAEIGLGVRETPLDVSICAVALLEGDLFVAADTALDERLACNPLVTGEPYLRFYAGAVLRTPEGLPIGTVCVLDYEPRPAGLNDDQAKTLKALARIVMTQLERRRLVATLEKRESELARVQEIAGIGGLEVDLKGDFVNSRSPRYLAIHGLPPEAANETHDDWLRRIHPDDRQPTLDHFIEVLQSDAKTYEAEYRIIRPSDGELRWMHVVAAIERDGQGRALKLIGAHRDVTERRLRELALETTRQQLFDSEERLRLALSAGKIGTWSWNIAASTVVTNENQARLLNLDPSETISGVTIERCLHAVHPDDRPRVESIMRQVIEAGGDYEVDHRLVDLEGGIRWVTARGRCTYDADGKSTSFSGVTIDITELKRLEEARSLISAELSHRILNLFAVVNGLIGISTRRHPEAKPFADSLRDRVSALAKAHQYVRQNEGDSHAHPPGRNLIGLVKLLFSPYVEAEEGRLLIAGDDIEIGSSAATSLSLFIHEQATNAVKYGSLSTPAGLVTLTCTSGPDDFGLVWRETGGPTILGAPERRGFGTDLATRSVTGQLGGTVEREWAAEGLIVRVTMPKKHLGR